MHRRSNASAARQPVSCRGSIGRARCALVAIALAVAVFTGCDSNNPGRDLGIVDGVYSLEELTFDPVTQSLPTADVGARLDQRRDHFGVGMVGGPQQRRGAVRLSEIDVRARAE